MDDATYQQQLDQQEQMLDYYTKVIRQLIIKSPHDTNIALVAALSHNSFMFIDINERRYKVTIKEM